MGYHIWNPKGPRATQPGDGVVAKAMWPTHPSVMNVSNANLSGTHRWGDRMCLLGEDGLDRVLEGS